MVGDITAQVTLAVLDDAGMPVDLETLFPDTSTARLLLPDYTAVMVVATPAPEGVTVDLLQTWDPAGLYYLSVDLAGPTGTVTTDPLPVITQQLDGWLTLGVTRVLWPDAATIPDQALWLILESAQSACVAYAPALPAQVSGSTRWITTSGRC